MGRKRCRKVLTILILENLRAILGHQTANIDVEHLAAVIADLVVFTGRQTTAVEIEDFDFIRIIDLLQRRADVSGLAARFFSRVLRCFSANGKTIF